MLSGSFFIFSITVLHANVGCNANGINDAASLLQTKATVVATDEAGCGEQISDGQCWFADIPNGVKEGVTYTGGPDHVATTPVASRFLTDSSEACAAKLASIAGSDWAPNRHMFIWNAQYKICLGLLRRSRSDCDEYKSGTGYATYSLAGCKLAAPIPTPAATPGACGDKIADGQCYHIFEGESEKIFSHIGRDLCSADGKTNKCDLEECKARAGALAGTDLCPNPNIFIHNAQYGKCKCQWRLAPCDGYFASGYNTYNLAGGKGCLATTTTTTTQAPTTTTTTLKSTVIGGATFISLKPKVASWEDAEADCVSRGGHLPSIHSEEENAAYFEFMGGQITVADLSVGPPTYAQPPTSNPLWLGSKDELGTWADGSPIDFKKWAPGEPNNGADTCIYVNRLGNPSTWGDDNCVGELGKTHLYACKLDGPTTTTTTAAPTTTQAADPYNCFTKELWTEEKSEWCCENKGLGCQATPTPAPVPTAAPTPAKVCRNSCHRGVYIKKKSCQRDKCAGCCECTGECEPIKKPPRPKKCLDKCYRKTKGNREVRNKNDMKKHMCHKNKCGACPECQPAPTPSDTCDGSCYTAKGALDPSKQCGKQKCAGCTECALFVENEGLTLDVRRQIAELSEEIEDLVDAEDLLDDDALDDDEDDDEDDEDDADDEA